MITTRLSGMLIATALALSLSGCGNEVDNTATLAYAKNLAPAALARMRGTNTQAATAPDLGLTRAAVEKVGQPLGIVTIASKNAEGLISKIGQNGGVETWSSSDQKTLSFRDGVLVATRGLGDDVMEAAVPGLSQLATDGDVHNRRYVFLTGDVQPLNQYYTCYSRSAGNETLNIVERSYSTRHMTEECKGPDGTFTNDFWFGSGGKLRQSRQWAGSYVGFLLIKRLSD